MRDKIIYTGSFNFPNHDAAAARVLGNAKVFKELGFKVSFYGMEKEERPQDLKPDGNYYYQGFEYISVNKNIKEQNILKNYINKGKKIFRQIIPLSGQIHSIVLYNSNTFFTRRAIRFCKENNINLILDLTEWYNGNHLPFGKFGPINLDNQYRMRRLNFKVKNIITISDFLYNYYNKENKNVIKIPPLVDFSEEKWLIERHEPSNIKPFRFVYAGTPAKKSFLGSLKEKDLLKKFIDAINHLKKEKNITIYLDVYGIHKKDFFSFYNISTLAINKQITCYGRIKQDLVPKQLINSDYSVLLRPIKKFTKAGFSTKLVESMSSGVPLFTNKHHGDVGNIIGDNEAGYLINSCSETDIIKGIEYLISEKNEIHKIRSKKAKKYAVTFFDYKNKIESFSSFFESIKN